MKMNKEEFNKEFPGLEGMGCGFITTNRPNGIKKQEQTYQQLDIQEKCLDKQKVIEAYAQLKASLGEYFFDKRKSPYVIIMTEFENELGLE